MPLTLLMPPPPPLCHHYSHFYVSILIQYGFLLSFFHWILLLIEYMRQLVVIFCSRLEKSPHKNNSSNMAGELVESTARLNTLQHYGACAPLNRTFRHCIFHISPVKMMSTNFQFWFIYISVAVLSSRWVFSLSRWFFLFVCLAGCCRSSSPESSTLAKDACPHSFWNRL